MGWPFSFYDQTSNPTARLGAKKLADKARELAKADATALVQQFGEVGKRKFNLAACGWGFSLMNTGSLILRFVPLGWIVGLGCFALPKNELGVLYSQRFRLVVNHARPSEACWGMLVEDIYVAGLIVA